MVIAVQMVPPFSKIFEIETKMKDIKYLNMLLNTRTNISFAARPLV
jgi:hypothetical protein